MARYVPGDVVQIRDDLKLDTMYYMEGEDEGLLFVPAMAPLLGQFVTIDEFCPSDGPYYTSYYTVIDCDGVVNDYKWVDDMFIEPAGFSPEDLSDLYDWM